MQDTKGKSRFRLTPVALLFAGTVMMGSSQTYAADDKIVNDLQAEIARLKAELEKSQRELATQKTTQPSNSTTPTSQAETPASTATTANAEQETALDSVVVRSRKKSVLEEVKDVPKSISIVSGEELEKQSALNVADIFKRIGNVKWNYGNPKTGSLSIRGVSAGSTEQIDPSLGVNVDGVPYAYVALASGSDFIDLESVSVERGPQGSTGGKNTSMGTIYIKTRQPTFSPEANASVTFGEQNALITQAAVGGAVIDDLLAWRGTFYRNQQEGYYENKYSDIQGRTSYVNTDRTYGRAQFLLTPTESFSANLSLDYKPKGIEFVNGLSVRNATPSFYRNGTAYAFETKLDPSIVLSRSYFTSKGYSYQDYLNTPINEDNNKGIMNASRGTSLQLNWNVLGGYNLKSITAYKDNYFQAGNDEGTPFDITKNSGLFVNYRQNSQEFRLTSPVDPKSLVDYTAGFIYMQTESDADTRTRYGSDAGAWYATSARYNVLTNNAASGLAGASAVNNAAGTQLMSDALNRVYAESHVYTDNKNAALYGQADWHLTDQLTLTTGIRFTKEDRESSANKLISDAGAGADLNPVAQGGFNATGANNTAQLNAADRVASKYFGATVTATPGAAYATLTAAQIAQVTAAQAIRTTAYSGLYGTSTATPYDDILKTGNISLAYKFNDDLTTYASWQHGAKAGISQINGVLVAATPTTAGVGRSFPAVVEESNAYELGVRTSWLDKTLIANADVFLDNLENFQQTMYVLDPLASVPGTYVSVTGNAPLVRIQGLEADISYSGLPYTTIRFAGSYNDARYAKDVLLAKPVEDAVPNTTAYYNANGRTLPNAATYTGNISAEYRRPVTGTLDFHTTFNYNFTSKFNSDASLSSYAWVDGYGITDWGIGVGRKDRSFDANFIVKNLFDTDYRNNQTWNSYVPTTNPRWIGITLSSKL